MASLIRQVFGSSRPGDIFRQLFTFERLATRPVVHLVYWMGMALLAIFAFAVVGIAVGTAIKEGLPMGVLLALPVLVSGWLGVAIVFLLWRAFCEFFMAVLSIAEDLRYLREVQERSDAPPPAAYSEPETYDRTSSPEDPFFNARLNRRD